MCQVIGVGGGRRAPLQKAPRRGERRIQSIGDEQREGTEEGGHGLPGVWSSVTWWLLWGLRSGGPMRILPPL